MQVIALQMQFRKRGKGVEDSVSQAGVVVDDLVRREQDGGDGGGDDDGQNHLGQFFGYVLFLVILKRFFAIPQQRLQAGAADADAQRVVVGQLVAPAGHGGFKILGIGVAQPGPQVPRGRGCDHLRINERMPGRRGQEAGP